MSLCVLHCWIWLLFYRKGKYVVLYHHCLRFSLEQWSDQDRWYCDTFLGISSHNLHLHYQKRFHQLNAHLNYSKFANHLPYSLYGFYFHYLLQKYFQHLLHICYFHLVTIIKCSLLWLRNLLKCPFPCFQILQCSITFWNLQRCSMVPFLVFDAIQQESDFVSE